MFWDFRISELRTLSNNETSSFLRKSHIGRLHLRSYSFGHYSRLMTISSTPDAIARRCVLGKDWKYRKCCFSSWGQAVYPLWRPSLTKYMQTEQLLCWSGMTDTEHTTSDSNEKDDHKWGWGRKLFWKPRSLFLSTNFFHDNRILQISHHCTSFAQSRVQFFVLPSITRESLPHDTWTFYLFQWCSTHLPWTVEHWSRFIPALSHAAAKSFNARWRPDSVEESKSRSSANNKRLILQFPIVAHS